MQKQVEVFFSTGVFFLSAKRLPPPFGDDVFCLGHMTSTTKVALTVRGVVLWEIQLGEKNMEFCTVFATDSEFKSVLEANMCLTTHLNILFFSADLSCEISHSLVCKNG